MISLVALLSGAAAPFLWVKGDAVIPGVRINGISAGGRSRAELMDVLDEQNRAMEKEKLALVKDSAREEWSYKDLHVRYDEHSLDEAMESEGREAFSNSGRSGGRFFFPADQPILTPHLMRMS